MAIQRFSIACGRESDYDRLLDLVFTLEILFGSGGPDSIKHKILIRLLNLLSEQKEVRHKLYDKMNEFYSARSSIGHGSKRKNSKFYRCLDNLENYEEIVRTGVYIFINTMKSENLNYDSMLEKLDYDKAKIYEIDMTQIIWKE